MGNRGHFHQGTRVNLRRIFLPLYGDEPILRWSPKSGQCAKLWVTQMKGVGKEQTETETVQSCADETGSPKTVFFPKAYARFRQMPGYEKP